MRSKRSSAWLRIGTAYMRHLVRRRVRPLPPTRAEVVSGIYQPDHLTSLLPEERALLSQLSRCINCGLCALAVGRVGGLRPADLPSYVRDLSLGSRVAADVAQLDVEATPTLEEAAAVCPTGVPLVQLADLLRRLANQ